jgi:hypothetical protein
MRAAADPNIRIGAGVLFVLLLVSLVFHVGLVAWKVSQAAKQPNGTAGHDRPRMVTSSAAEIRQVVEKVRERQAEEVRLKVVELIEARRRLEDIRQEKLAEYRENAEKLSVDAPKLAGESQEAVAKAQQQAVAVQQQAVQAVAALLKARQEVAAQSDPALKAAALTQVQQAEDNARSLQGVVKSAQLDADAAQSGAEGRIGLAKGDFTAALEAQRRASAAQKEADDAQDAVQKAQDAAIRSATAAKSAADALQRQMSQMKYIRERATYPNDQVVKAQLALNQMELLAQVAVQKATSAEESVKSASTASEGKKAGILAKTERSKADQAAKAAVTARQQLEKHRKEAAEAEARVVKAQNDVETAQAAADAAGKLPQQKEEEIVKSQDQAVLAQTRAAEVQQAARQALAKTIPNPTAMPMPFREGSTHPDAETLQAGSNQTKVPEKETEKTTEASPAESSDLGKLNFAELYAKAVATERLATAAYHEIKAASTAMAASMPIDQARGITEEVLPTREPIDTALLSKTITDAGEASAHTQAVRAALREIDSMTALARKMTEGAVGQSSASRGLTVNTGSAASGFDAASSEGKAVEEAAKQDDTHRAKDLSDLMKGVASKATPNQAKAESAGGGGGGGEGSTEGTGLAPGGQGNVSAANPAPFLAPKGVGSVPGRKVIGSGPSADWMYVDSWYVIGPFPNPGRRNLNTAFPPETVIDLDATYPGLDMKPVKWRFLQSGAPMVNPAGKEMVQAIYYAVTEVWFDQPTDTWVAMGADDFAKVWINGMPVWSSLSRPKPWIVNEAFRKVHFIKGVNRILFRIENAMEFTDFSFLICTKP